MLQKDGVKVGAKQGKMTNLPDEIVEGDDRTPDIQRWIEDISKVVQEGVKFARVWNSITLFRVKLLFRLYTKLMKGQRGQEKRGKEILLLSPKSDMTNNSPC